MLRERVFLGGQAISMLGGGLAVLAVPLLVMQLTGSPVAAVLASVPGSAGYLAAGLPAGVLADRLNPWKVLISTAQRTCLVLPRCRVPGRSPGRGTCVLAGSRTGRA